MNPEDTPLRTKLLQETARIAWQDLRTYHEQGRIIRVTEDLNLLDVAVAMAEDNAASISQWLERQQLSRLDTATAEHWDHIAPQLWAVVVRPWVLVQFERKTDYTS